MTDTQDTNPQPQQSPMPEPATTPPITPAEQPAAPQTPISPAPTPEPVQPATPPPTQPAPEPATQNQPDSPPQAAPNAAATTPQADNSQATTNKYQVKIIESKCIGAASCVAVAPKAFKLNDQQIAVVLPTISEESDENILLAAQSCPTLAIEIVDVVSGEQVWPK